MKSYEKALELFNTKTTVTPKELEDHVGSGPYASKIIWDLKQRGHTFTVTKNGRNIVSYTLNSTMSVPAAVEDKPVEKTATPKLTSTPVEQNDGALVAFAVDSDWDSLDVDVRELMR